MRLINRPLAALLSLALIAAGALLIVEVTANRLFNRAALVNWQRLYDWAERTCWTQGSIRVGSIALAIVGLVLLLAEIRRDAQQRLPINSELTDAAFTRRGVATTIRRAVCDVDGVNHTTVTVKRRKVAVSATTASRQPLSATSVRESVTAAARQRLDSLELSLAPRLFVRVTTRSH